MSGARLPCGPAISVVVITRNEGDRLRATVENLLDTLPPRRELLVIDDGSEDGSTGFLARRRAHVRLLRSRDLGVAKARNLGARRTRGNVIVFADAHISLGPGWWKPLVELLDDPRVGAAAPAIVDMRRPRRAGYGLTLPRPDLEADWMSQHGTSPYPVPVLPGCCLAMRRETFEATGGFDDGLVSTGGVDNEFSLRHWLLGYRLFVVPDTEVRHLFRSRFPYPVKWRSMLHNRLRLAFAHLGPARLAKVVHALCDHGSFGSALALAFEGGVLERRAQLCSCRVKKDDWFFSRFGIQW